MANVSTTPAVDHGPDIRRRAVVGAGGAVLREADTVVTRRPDPDRPERAQDIEVAIRWLPHRWYAEGKLTKDQFGAASWYRDLMDKAAGTNDRTPGHAGRSDPEKLVLVIDRVVDASIALLDADMALGAERAALVKTMVLAASKTEVALTLGIAAARVPAECGRVLSLLDEWRTRYARR